jgi:hypothetical protein
MFGSEVMNEHHLYFGENGNNFLTGVAIFYGNSFNKAN